MAPSSCEIGGALQTEYPDICLALGDLHTQVSGLGYPSPSGQVAAPIWILCAASFLVGTLCTLCIWRVAFRGGGEQPKAQAPPGAASAPEPAAAAGTGVSKCPLGFGAGSALMGGTKCPLGFGAAKSSGGAGGAGDAEPELSPWHLSDTQPPASAVPYTMLLTGGSRGIGHGTAKLFAAAGWRVITCSRTPFAAGKCPWAAGRLDHVEVDLCDPADTRRAIVAIKALLDGQPLHALVNNAAISPKNDAGGRLSSIETSLETFQKCPPPPPRPGSPPLSPPPPSPPAPAPPPASSSATSSRR